MTSPVLVSRASTADFPAGLLLAVAVAARTLRNGRRSCNLKEEPARAYTVAQVTTGLACHPIELTHLRLWPCAVDDDGRRAISQDQQIPEQLGKERSVCLEVWPAGEWHYAELPRPTC
jgi:hypothetical protein